MELKKYEMLFCRAPLRDYSAEEIHGRLLIARKTTLVPFFFLQNAGNVLRVTGCNIIVCLVMDSFTLYEWFFLCSCKEGKIIFRSYDFSSKHSEENINK